MLPYCLLSWAGQRGPTLNSHVIPALIASFLASFEALRERKGASMRDGVVRKTRPHQKVQACGGGPTAENGNSPCLDNKTVRQQQLRGFNRDIEA